MNTLLIFIKNPIKGKAKTRLAKTVGDEEALRIYKELLRHTRQVTEQVAAKRHLYYAYFIDTEDEWPITSFQKYLQQGGGLGERMTNAFRHAFQDAQKVVIIGSDCATLTPNLIEQAFEQLTNHDFVIGPAEDGGYYLLGMQALMPFVFENVRWSSPTVLNQTIEHIKSHHKTYCLLPILSDIDTEADWKKYGW